MNLLTEEQHNIVDGFVMTGAGRSKLLKNSSLLLAFSIKDDFVIESAIDKIDLSSEYSEFVKDPSFKAHLLMGYNIAEALSYAIKDSDYLQDLFKDELIEAARDALED